MGPTDGQDDFVARMLLKVVVPWKLLPTQRARLAVVQRPKQTTPAKRLPSSQYSSSSRQAQLLE